MERITRSDLYMSIAMLIANRSICERGQVGVIAVKDKRIIATGYNGPISNSIECPRDCNLLVNCEHSIHAEANLIAFCAKHGISLTGSSIYCTHSPCKNCGRLLIQSGVKNVYYCKPHKDTDWNNLIMPIYEHKWENIIGVTLTQKERLNRS